MFKKINQKQELAKRIIAYAAMVFSVIVIVAAITSSILGFRFNFQDKQIERYAFLRFNSTPVGASVFINDQLVNQKTPTKSSTKPGVQNITMKKDGYRPWSKQLDVKAGALTWLNYALLVPDNLVTEPLLKYDNVYKSLAAPSNKSLIIQPVPNLPEFILVEINSNISKTTSLVLDSLIYSESTNPDMSHRFEIVKWDGAGRYVLLAHYYNEQREWLLLDTNNIELSKNITKTFDIAIDQIEFLEANGNNYFILGNGDIRKLDLSAGTISKVLIKNVEAFSVYRNNIIFIGQPDDQSTGKTVGIYRDGDDGTRIIKQTQNSEVKMATSRYFNEDYIAYSDGLEINLLSGSYPDISDNQATSQSLVASFKVEFPIDSLEFSPTSQYVVARSVDLITSYDIEYGNLSSFSLGCPDDNLSLGWLNETYIWSSCQSKLSIREFDGANINQITSVTPGQSALMTNNNRYIYSLAKGESNYILQRTKLIND